MKKLCKDSLSMQNPVLHKMNITTVKTLEYLMDSCIGKDYVSLHLFYSNTQRLSVGRMQ